MEWPDKPPYSARRCEGFEIAVIDCTGRAFSKHSHDEYVFSANICGREHIWLDGRSHEAGTDDLTVYHPGQVQASHAQGTPWRIASIYIGHDWLAEATDTVDGPRFDRPLLGGGATKALCGIVSRAFRAGEPDEAIEQALLSFIGALPWSNGRAPTLRASATKDLACRVAARLRAEVSSPPELAAIARSEGMTRVGLLRAFKAAFGLPPFAWLANERLKEARRRLSKGDAVASVAADLGFADQPHLTRAFKAAYGVTPARYAMG